MRAPFASWRKVIAQAIASDVATAGTITPHRAEPTSCSMRRPNAPRVFPDRRALDSARRIDNTA
ncbi:hypothetical protein WI23_26560 [Burkholderia oklahomensis C6786]|nr:hypothetical protein WI23_26560 [Burkholderia oklahomensis C6786]KUY60611.1 hypothetical protein WI23_12945 [Burkholderia oklahomensis C6786]